MITRNEKEYLVGTADYNTNFWNHMRGNPAAKDKIHDGRDTTTGGFDLPQASENKLAEAIVRESIFRKIATTVDALGGASRIYAKDTDDVAAWVPEGEEIPIRDGMDDFEQYPVDVHKLSVFVKLDDDFIHDATFNIEDYLTGRLALNFARAEDAAFVSGDGKAMPSGLCTPGAGANMAFATDNITFDDVVRLFFSVDPAYRDHGTWMMNDSTACTIRTMKDVNGVYLWNEDTQSILGKPVAICNAMPDIESGSMPIVFGDFRYYWIIRRNKPNIRQMKELFITKNQVGYLANEFLDGKLIRREAICGIGINSTDPDDLSANE
ncbi:MAG: phage major capsid protein [Actinomycetaceae bacterium]|nr:phage major capsid protein [Actinomycetaceae bacterium]